MSDKFEGTILQYTGCHLCTHLLRGPVLSCSCVGGEYYRKEVALSHRCASFLGQEKKEELKVVDCCMCCQKNDPVDDRWLCTGDTFKGQPVEAINCCRDFQRGPIITDWYTD